MALADHMITGALSRRERLLLGVGLTVLSLVARLAECFDRGTATGGGPLLATQYPHKPTRR
jgi:hypothetical protein